MRPIRQADVGIQMQTLKPDAGFSATAPAKSPESDLEGI
jgi:hypothetical protein